ncbi:guanine nucleotide binding protein, alpha subunit [Crepidotus variabilis]|uniref:Guanine nucleotide binding protein, alpha subunit n=1 Tax=Crepidotus variabilis TaxID=179855 RepID=A0A9P6JNZ9_9AGAR|nr:guanine nucleotide binding protein, alpha subunit [Crepidotus variabilis]
MVSKVSALSGVETLLTAHDDPLTMSITPPATETLSEKTERLALEQHAKQISDQIDQDIERERERERKAAKCIKVLLLGQSESGKSTTLKNFQLLYDPKTFRSQRPSWRAVIQLNVVRSFHTILEAITRAQKHDREATSTSPSSPRRSPSPKIGPIQLSPELLETKARLDQLVDLEKSIVDRLTTAGGGSKNSDLATAALLLAPGPIDTTIANTQLNESPSSPTATLKKAPSREVAINSSIPWKEAFNKLLRASGERSSIESRDIIDFDDPEDPGHVLHACSKDMIQLWNDHTVRHLLEKQKVRLEQSSGFFLDSLDRITGERYTPTDDDILKARLKTLGVSEYRFKLKDPASSGSLRDWKVYDVGGHRSQRAAWVPYFDDMDAIIFLAPISCFDEVLEEDHKINRLEDTFKLWTSIVSNPLLKNTNIILFLNKVDILRTKLAGGVMLKDHVVSYGDRPNDVDNVTAYLRRKFAGIMQEKSSSPRVFYGHLTTVIDTSSTNKILANLRDMLMRQNLQQTNLLY